MLIPLLLYTLIPKFIRDFWWMIIPIQLVILYFWFFNLQKKVSKVARAYYTIVLILFFGNLDCLGLLFSLPIQSKYGNLYGGIIIMNEIWLIISSFLLFFGLIVSMYQISKKSTT